MEESLSIILLSTLMSLQDALRSKAAAAGDWRGDDAGDEVLSGS